HDNTSRENRIIQLRQVISRARVSVWPSTCADEPDCRFVRDRRADSWPIGGLRPSHYNTADETRSARPDRCFRGAHAHDAAVFFRYEKIAEKARPSPWTSTTIPPPSCGLCSSLRPGRHVRCNWSLLTRPAGCTTCTSLRTTSRPGGRN